VNIGSDSGLDQEIISATDSHLHGVALIAYSAAQFGEAQRIPSPLFG
jgi:hypothetical protein